MAAKNSVWGIDVGQAALKAVKLIRGVDGNHQLAAFEVIEHSQILSNAGDEAPMVVQTSLDAFLARHDVTDSELAVSVLGQTSFTRFVKLPPVETKKIPDIVRFEAEQQIPFDIDEVTWRWQTFLDPDSPDVEVGIFAMKKADVSEMLSYFLGAGMEVDTVQMAPLALYNMMVFDQQIAEDGATLLLDVGADKTHLVIADGARTWTRTIQIGGNSFTEALVKSFKLPFAKAEKLKRTAASSKYARQIFQVMRPVFADMVQEIQRTIGHYTQRHRESRFTLLVGTGNGFRLPGMQKYLEQNLNMNVQRVDSYHRIAGAGQEFQSQALSMGVAVGLAAQALGEAPVETNLLPEAIIAKRRWSAKKPWFAVAAAALVVAAALYPLNAMSDQSKLASPAQQDQLSDARSLISQWEQWQKTERGIVGDVDKQREEIQQHLQLRAYAPIWPRLQTNVNDALRLTLMTPQDRQALQQLRAAGVDQREQVAQRLQSDQAVLSAIGMLPYTDAAEGQTTLRERLIQRLASRPRQQRRILLVESQPCQYSTSLTPSNQPEAEEAMPEMGRRSGGRRGRNTQATQDGKAKRGFEMSLICRTPLALARASELQTALKNRLQAQLDADANFEVVEIVITPLEAEATTATGTERRSPGRGGIGRGISGGTTTTDGEEPVGDDPLFPTEMTAQDARFSIDMKIAVVNDGLEDETQAEAAEQTSSRHRRSR
ncbi:MAG: type IV pilus assembly protein PilM [Planctomycetes bacterium]|jgi:type IV pilus assembly protein PilM|nr:type IV pilus assembly protein PilM [Phycisphaerae bacterium]NBB96345.1 type IV pilus assembly protein PilM [Planctomycetota bacterium]